VDYREINAAIKSPTQTTTVRLIRGHSQATIAQTPRLRYESLLRPRSYPNCSTQYNMSCKPKNEYKQVAYLNQMGKYKSTSEHDSGWGSRIQTNTAPEEAPTGQDSSESLLLYSISLISILIASLDLVDLYLMFWLFISSSGLLQGGLALYL